MKWRRWCAWWFLIWIVSLSLFTLTKKLTWRKTKELFFSFHPSSVHESCIVSNENDSKVSFLEKFYTVVYNFRTDNREPFIVLISIMEIWMMDTQNVHLQTEEMESSSFIHLLFSFYDKCLMVLVLDLTGKISSSTCDRWNSESCILVFETMLQSCKCVNPSINCNFLSG